MLLFFLFARVFFVNEPNMKRLHGLRTFLFSAVLKIDHNENNSYFECGDYGFGELHGLFFVFYYF